MVSFQHQNSTNVQLKTIWKLIKKHWWNNYMNRLIWINKRTIWMTIHLIFQLLKQLLKDKVTLETKTSCNLARTLSSMIHKTIWSKVLSFQTITYHLLANKTSMIKIWNLNIQILKKKSVKFNLQLVKLIIYAQILSLREIIEKWKYKN